jgi:nuclease S1
MKIKIVLPLAASLLFGALFLPAAALAWGSHSHELVAEIAARHLEPTARGEVERLLGDRADLAMRDVATWADQIREQPKFRDTGPMHYVNFERGVCRYDARRSCRNGRCVVAAIGDYVKRLADRNASDHDRAEALAFVIHFVGDIHQPLHAGWRDDRGGNDVQVRVGRKGTNLHALWDDALARQARLRVREHADKLLATPLAKEQLSWQDTAPVAWAVESCRLIADDLYPQSPDIDETYLKRTLPIAENRIELAGRRLAVLLNTILR